MSIRSRIVMTGTAMLLCLPMLARAIPISYSFTGELTAFESDDGITQRTLESLGSRAITGMLSYDTDRQDWDLSGLFRIAFAGEGFHFDAGHAGIEGSQAIHRDDTAATDFISFFEFYEYMLPESMDTLTTTLDLYGEDLLNPGIGPPDSMIDPAALDLGTGLFGSTSWDYAESVTRLNGAFRITSLDRLSTSVPEPGSAALSGTALLLFALSCRFGRRRATRRDQDRSSARLG